SGGRFGGNFDGQQIGAVVPSRCGRLRPILLAHLCGRRHRELYDGSDRAGGDERRSEILHHGHGRIFQAYGIRGEPAVYHQDGRGKKDDQFIGTGGGRGGGGDRQCILSGTIQSVCENLSALGNGSGLGRRVQRIERV